MDEVVYYSELYDLYGGLLTEKQRQYFEDYYFENLSLSEMADDYDISRNAAFKQVHIAMEKLQEYENILHLKEKREKIFDVIKDFPDVKKRIEEII